MYQPPAMRWRGVTVLTNTPPRVSQSQPGGFQGIALMEPILSKAARKLGIDQVAIHRINCPGRQSAESARRWQAASGPMSPALHQGSAGSRRASSSTGTSARRSPSAAARRSRGIGVATSCFVGGSVGFDGLFVIKPDGTLYIQSRNRQSGHRIGAAIAIASTAEMLGVPWEKCEITWGNTAKNLPWSCPSGGSQTTHAMTRAAYVAAMDAKDKLQQIAAKDLGGKPEDYEVANERVFRKGGGAGMSLAQAAKRAIELGGIYDGHELPKGINKMTVASATGARRAGVAGRRPRHHAARRPDALLSSLASPRWKWISKPANTRSWITWPWRTWAR